MDAHPDVMLNMGIPNLQRNMSERNRMQRLMRIPTMRGRLPMDARNLKLMLKERRDLWMVNESGHRLFYFIIFLHILFLIFGWSNYVLKDNYVTARATFGVTFGL